MNENIKNLFNLISPTRLRPSTRPDKDNVLMATESDKGRVINAASFRRLQQKAQVFPLESNAAVRSRLTHSIEVSQVGRYLAQEIIRKISEKYNLLQLFDATPNGNHNLIYEKLASFSNTIETACLLHDIGNPPFGHLGEAAIQKWFKDKNSSENTEGIEYFDLPYFDGNAQGLRLVTFLNGQDIVGLNLTCTTLLSMIKYPKILSVSPKKAKGIYRNDFKFCYEKSCASLSWVPGKVFPFALLMETADDISYCTSDLEDGLEKGVISERQLFEAFPDIYPTIDQNDSTLTRFIKFKTKIINDSVQEAANNFISKLQDILNPENSAPVELLTTQRTILDKIKIFARQNIYSNSQIETIELAGYNIICGLLDSYELILKMETTDFNELFESSKNTYPFERRLFKSIPETYRKKYQAAKEHFDANPTDTEIPKDKLEKNLRAQMIVDFIAGMTIILPKN